MFPLDVSQPARFTLRSDEQSWNTSANDLTGLVSRAERSRAVRDLHLEKAYPKLVVFDVSSLDRLTDKRLLHSKNHAYIVCGAMPPSTTATRFILLATPFHGGVLFVFWIFAYTAVAVLPSKTLPSTGRVRRL